jgi:hypothetical protein
MDDHMCKQQLPEWKSSLSFPGPDMLRQVYSAVKSMLIYIHKVRPKSSVNGTRGERKKERKKKKRERDTNKLTIVAFKMIPILHNTRLVTFIKASGNCQERPL